MAVGIKLLLLLKANKNPSQRESYRPVSLTSVSVKVMERMVTILLVRSGQYPKKITSKLPKNEKHGGTGFAAEPRIKCLVCSLCLATVDQ